MNAAVLALKTQVPEEFLTQELFGERVGRLLGFREEEERLLRKILKGTMIGKRHTAVKDMFDAGCFPSISPGTGARNALYKTLAPALAEEVAKKALHEWGGDPSGITHVISVSCTGCIAPGIEFILVDRLKLPRHVERLGVNFMGCYGAFKGLAVARALAEQDPAHRVLLVCTELCSLHFQEEMSKEALVSNSLFADGAGAAVVGCAPKKDETPLFSLRGSASLALEGSLDLMTWTIGDTGFKMGLSPKVPEAIEKEVLDFTKRILNNSAPFEEVLFAVHPGGRAIVDAVAKACSLDGEQLEATWRVLKEYGNMSSPTFLFVLEEILKEKSAREWVVGLGFGPGLSMEGLLLKREGSYVAK